MFKIKVKDKERKVYGAKESYILVSLQEKGDQNTEQSLRIVEPTPD